ncbi:hypothetical protein D0864_08538 [Hortaea werneckii]|uniref:SEC7 domain-containing protein n=1 Tax=Hortaea werneckii TaxID=91943 RepID=A0A3M7EW59_HORWE|nr:hypothetical protein D0864_08538 [Hortaea werneckii]
MADEEQQAATSQQPEQPDETRQSQGTEGPAREEEEGATDTQESEHDGEETGGDTGEELGEDKSARNETEKIDEPRTEATAPIPDDVTEKASTPPQDIPRADEPVPDPEPLPEPEVTGHDTPSDVQTQEATPTASVPETPASEAPNPIPQTVASRARTDSASTTMTNSSATTRGATRSSMVFVVTALESIAASKDARKRKPLQDSTQRALSAIRSASGDASQINPEIMFEPLNLATEANTVTVVTTALDCIGKLISYSYFSAPPSSNAEGQPQKTPLIERAIDTICDCFQGEATPNEVQMQIIKSLLAAILNDKIVVHGAGLLKSVRQTYNIFLLSKSSANQQIAQGTLVQMVNTVFERVKVRLAHKSARDHSSEHSLNRGSSSELALANGEGSPTEDVPDEDEGETSALPSDVEGPAEPESSAENEERRQKMTLATFETRRSFDDANIADSAPTTVFTDKNATIRASGSGEATGFTQAVKQYLCLSLSRNGASSTQKVFEVAAEVFWLITKFLRPQLKRELEVFLKEIYLTILEKRAAPSWQKSYIVQHLFRRVCDDGRCLVELYLNYDCDRQALDNMYQRIIEHISRLAGQPVQVNGLQQQAYLESLSKKETGSDWRERGTLPPSLATANMTEPLRYQSGEEVPPEYALKMQSLETLAGALRSLVSWGQQGISGEASGENLHDNEAARGSVDDLRESLDTRGDGSSMGAPPTPTVNSIEGAQSSSDATGTPIAEDDPAELEKVKQRKTALNNAIRQFNFKPKRGLKALLKDGFIPSSSPQDIASFMSNNERINKKSLGEFLGEGDEENIKIMHAFVDFMDFSRTRFVDALRRFLQSFRLPGEAQKIDRLMLKFAERYTTGNPAAFANADTAYVLAYSVIMLNTDQHSAQVKNRMTPEDFIKNNRGINDNADLPEDYLRGTFEEISHNEIVLDTERETAANLGFAQQGQQGGGVMSALANVGRDLQREAYAQASDEMSNRTEQLFRSLLRAQKRTAAGGSATGLGGPAVKGGSRYLTASSSKHVGPMFEVTWMSFLTALSGSAQETQNLETIHLCMSGQKLAIRVACLFDLEDPRQAFVSSLASSTNLYNLSEMRAKNVEALRALLEVAQTEGNMLKESWRDVLTCISQLDRFQLISSGVEEGAVPDMLRASNTGNQMNGAASRKSVQLQRRQMSRTPTSGSYAAEVAEEARNADTVRAVDRIFTSTAVLSGDAIVHFVRALTQVSWQEIQSSGQSDSPRTYSLQKLVEISGYNMLRVRFEWTNIWQVLGQHFIDVGCHNNTHVVFFALNSLRQLSMRFLEIEELPGFKFQKDFLKPFELILSNASQVAVKDMVLRCLIQMIQAKGDMIRSGWRTMFGVFTVAAREHYESIVHLAFDNVTSVYNNRFGVVISQGALADLVVCLTEFSKNMKFQKKSLQAIETLRSSVPKMLRTPECPLSQKVDVQKDAPTAEGLPKQPSRQTQEEQYWFPVLFAFHDVLMTGEDLEVRSRALNYLFEILTKYGGGFPRDFWDTLWRQLLYPIFMVLKDRKAVNQESTNHEELSVWLSTTLIQALRNMITLFTHFFDSLEYMLDRFLDLLALCICQENDTLARIGSNCLQQLILQNVKKFSPVHWEKIVGSFVDLFARTEARELFSAATASSYRRESETVNGLSDTPAPSTGDDSASISSANALRINGLSDPTSSEVSTVNGDSRSATTNTGTSDSLTLGTEHSPSPSRKPSELEDFASTGPKQQQAPVVVTAARRRYFNQIITKCVLQLLMIETVSELFNNDSVYASIPSHLLLRLMALLKKSYHFAKRFNEDRDLRTRLFREGFMKQPPNLLKQESGSASVYVLILLRMYADTSEERAASRPETEAALIPLCSDILASYISLDEETQQRNIVTWRPVVIDVLQGYTGFAPPEFSKHVATFAPLAVGLMNRDMGPELQRAVQELWQRVCEVQLGIEKMPDMAPVPAPTSPRATVFGRRGSKQR